MFYLVGLVCNGFPDSREWIRHAAHRGMLPVLHFDPVRRSAGAIGAIPALGHQLPTKAIRLDRSIQRSATGVREHGNVVAHFDQS
jgi:hypothetical protein